MDSREKVERLKRMHEYLLKRLEEYRAESAPEGLNMKKLEEAFDSLEEYRFVLKKVA